MPFFKIPNRAARLRRREQRRDWARRQLRRVAVLPSLMTLANGVCGLAAVQAVTSHAVAMAALKATTAATTTAVLPPLVATTTPTVAGLSTVIIPDGFALAGVLLILGMMADALDGQLARFTRQTTDFGGQLDSLCDVVSFGVAPAIIAYYLVSDLTDHTAFTTSLGQTAAGMVRQLTGIAAAGYFACATLRLARFNVENAADESAHIWFKGLPSPGAAAGVGALILLRQAALSPGAPRGAVVALALAVPVVIAGLGLLMVSRYRYPHLVGQYIHQRGSFGYLARLVAAVSAITVVLVATGPLLAGAAAIFGYILASAIPGVLRQLTVLPPLPVSAPTLLGSSAPTANAPPPPHGGASPAPREDLSDPVGAASPAVAPANRAAD